MLHIAFHMATDVYFYPYMLIKCPSVPDSVLGPKESTVEQGHALALDLTLWSRR